MSHRRSSSTSVRSVTPALEILEDRLAPAGLDLNQLGQQFLNDAKQAVTNNVKNLAESTVFTLQNGQINAEQLNRHTAAFNDDPHNLGALISMGVDTNQLEIRALLAYQQVQQLAGYLKTAEETGLVSGAEAIALEATLSVAAQDAGALLAAAVQGEENLDAAIFAYVTSQVHGTLTEPLPHPLGVASPPASPPSPPSPPPSPPGTVSENVTDAPDTASASGGKVTESVTVTNPTGSTVHVAINYQSTDGSTASASDDCTNSTVTVSLPVNPSAEGNTGSWTVTATGLADHTNTTSFIA